MRNDLISVIMPAYNAEKYIEEAICSIKEQTYSNWEMIIIDDGSNDSTAQIVLKHVKSDNRIRMISRENKGLVSSLNEGIESAAGKFIARMDADDICDSTRLKKQISYLWNHPEVHLVGTNVSMFFEENVRSDLKELSKKNETLWNEEIDSFNRFESNMEGFKIVHATWMIRKELFDYIGKYHMTATEDAEFLFRTIINGFNIDKVPEKLYQYRIRNESKSDEDRRGNEHKQEIIKFKLDYLESVFGTSMQNMKYVIWGADVSGELALEMLDKRFPQTQCVGVIDGIKRGKWHGMTICSAEEGLVCESDFFFICTRGGAKNAVEFLEKHGKVHIQDFMKIS